MLNKIDFKIELKRKRIKCMSKIKEIYETIGYKVIETQAKGEKEELN